MHRNLNRAITAAAMTAAAMATLALVTACSSGDAQTDSESSANALGVRPVKALRPIGGTVKARSARQVAAAAAGGFDYPATRVGVAGDVTVMYDPDLGQPALDLANKLLSAAATPYANMRAFFGTAGAPHTVIVAPLSGNNDGSGGAYHYGCDFDSGGVLYVDATFASTSVNPLNLEVALYVAELSEAFMGQQGTGWDCGGSNGEGLSRFLAEEETPWGTLAAYATGQAWAQAGFPDWVSRTESTDQDGKSTGCAVVYIDWMRSKGFSTAQIVQAGGDTLSANYQALTHKTTGAADLKAAVRGLTVKNDDPFGIRPATGGGT